MTDTLRVKNLTPHTVTVQTSDTSEVEFAPSGTVARVALAAEPLPTISIGEHAVPVVAISYGNIENLPEPRGGVALLVSRVVAERLPGRDDLVFADDFVRSEDGRVVACRRLARFADDSASRP